MDSAARLGAAPSNRAGSTRTGLVAPRRVGLADDDGADDPRPRHSRLYRRDLERRTHRARRALCFRGGRHRARLCILDWCDGRVAVGRNAHRARVGIVSPSGEQNAGDRVRGLLRSGTLAAVVGSANGRDRHLFDILPGDTVGDIETLDGGRTLARIAVTSAVAHVVLIPRGIVLSALLADGVFARRLATICAQRARSLGAQFLSHVAQPAISRVAAAILPYASPDVGLSPAFEPLQRMTQNQLAIIAGTAKEVAARAIAELEAAGVLQRTEGHIARIDRAKLQTYVTEQ